MSGTARNAPKTMHVSFVLFLITLLSRKTIINGKGKVYQLSWMATFELLLPQILNCKKIFVNISAQILFEYIY
jgi:hypothetical protein